MTPAETPTECEACRAHKAVWGNDDCPCDHVGMDRVSKGALWSAVQEKDARIRELEGLLDEAMYHLTVQTGALGSMAADFDVREAIDFRNRPDLSECWLRHARALLARSEGRGKIA